MSGREYTFFSQEFLYKRKKTLYIPIKTRIVGIILYGLYNMFSVRGTINT